MNGNMNGNSWYTATIDSTYFTYRKYSEIVRPPPTGAFVFVDEHPDDIGDGYLLVNMTAHNGWGNMPANYHNGACGFSFADGHSEIKRWQVSTTIVPFSVWPVPTGPDRRDFLWVSQRATYPQ